MKYKKRTDEEVAEILQKALYKQEHPSIQVDTLYYAFVVVLTIILGSIAFTNGSIVALLTP